MFLPISTLDLCEKCFFSYDFDIKMFLLIVPNKNDKYMNSFTIIYFELDILYKIKKNWAVKFLNFLEPRSVLHINHFYGFMNLFITLLIVGIFTDFGLWLSGVIRGSMNRGAPRYPPQGPGL